MFYALLRFRPEGEADLGWHLAQGRLLFEGHWLRTNALAWTAKDAPWVDTSWLFDLIEYISAKICGEVLGPKLVIGFFFGLTVLFLGLACRALSPLGVWVIPAAALLLIPRATPRPHAASWSALACVLWLCIRARRLEREGSLGSQASARRLRLLALIAIWVGAQLHAGAAFACAPLALFSLESLWRTRSRIALLPIALAPLALIAGPAGPASVIHLLRHWNLGEVIDILEFEHWSWKTEPCLPPLLVAALFPLLFSRAEKTAIAAGEPEPNLLQRFLLAPQSQLALLACVALFGSLAFRTARVFYECAVVCTPALALLVEEIRVRQNQRTAALALIFATVLCALPHHLADQLAAPGFDPRWNEQLVAVRATRFLEENKLDGPGFNGLRDGGYLAWMRPAVPIFADARIHAYPNQFWRDFEAAEKSPALFDRYLREKGAIWALTERERERLGGYRLLEGNPGWALVYWDDTRSIYLRRDQPQLASLIESFEYKRVHPWGNLLAEMRSFDRAQLDETDAELLRFLKTTPGDAVALSMACASKKLEHDPGADSLCELAEQAASSTGNEQLIGLARAARNR